MPRGDDLLAQNEVIDFFVRHKLLQGGTYSPPGGAVQVPERRSGLTILTKGFVEERTATVWMSMPGPSTKSRTCSA